MKGFIHSIDSFGTVDGPGIRMVIFFQGCPMRCMYCHNPDTWCVRTGNTKTVDELLAEYEKNKVYYSSGGITATGGEPMLQIDFLIELFTEAKKRNIHTCLDTSGITFPGIPKIALPSSKDSEDNFYHNTGSNNDSCTNILNDANLSTNIKSYSQTNTMFDKIEQLMKVTDLVMLDIKHIDSEHHKKITARDNKCILEFLSYLDQIQKAVWIRHVVVPGLTDDPKWLQKLGYEIGDYNCIKALDVLPYHSMGVSKYKELGIPYPLEGTKDGTKELAIQAKAYILSGIKLKKQKVNSNDKNPKFQPGSKQ